MSEELKQTILRAIRSRIEDHPRGKQREIGPSEIGHPCDRWITYKLSDTPEVPKSRDKWRPTVGTAVHSWLADAFEELDARLRAATGSPVWLVEDGVLVGSLTDGEDIWGSCDLFAVPWKTTVDWKIVGKSTLDAVRRSNDPGPQYRIQAHSYGRGWVNAGYEVETVAVFYLPASGTLDQAVWWEEPYDESVCTQALQRLDRLQDVVGEFGVAAPSLVQPTGFKCGWCPWYDADSRDLTRSCPGEGMREDPLMKLVAPGEL